MTSPEAHEDANMINEQRKEALLYLEDIDEILCDVVKGENDIRAQLVCLMDLEITLKELMDLCKNDSAYRDLIFTTEFAFHIQICFPDELYRKLRECEGEGLALFENMVKKIEELRENAQEEVDELNNALYGHDTMSTMEIIEKSETKSMTEISVNNAKKVEVFKLSEQQMMEKNLKVKVSLDYLEPKPVTVDHDENEQLDDHEARIADVHSLGDLPVTILEQQKDLNAIFNKEDVEHNSDGIVDDLKGAFADDDPNINGDQKKEVVVAV